MLIPIEKITCPDLKQQGLLLQVIRKRAKQYPLESIYALKAAIVDRNIPKFEPEPIPRLIASDPVIQQSKEIDVQIFHLAGLINWLNPWSMSEVRRLRTLTHLRILGAKVNTALEFLGSNLPRAGAMPELILANDDLSGVSATNRSSTSFSCLTERVLFILIF